MELIQKFEDLSPDCNNEECQKFKDTTTGCKMIRIMGLSNFQLKGSGWFRDGYSKGK